MNISKGDNHRNMSRFIDEIGYKGNPAYECWLNYRPVKEPLAQAYRALCKSIRVTGDSPILCSAVSELTFGIERMLQFRPEKQQNHQGITLTTLAETDLITPSEKEQVADEGYIIRHHENGFIIAGKKDRGILYGVFAFLRQLQLETTPEAMNRLDNPTSMLRMINHWDNLDGSIERGYAGKSIFFRDNKFIHDIKRMRDYARLLASVGINSVIINNVNVHYHETLLIADYLPDVAKMADVFRQYGIAVYLSINYSSPMQLGGLSNADPLDPDVQKWWCEKAAEIYKMIPDLGGFLVKADSEHRPGPFTYGRDHADGANMLAKALQPFGGIVIWRCFVYNCKQDWRDKVTDRANAAYDTYMPLDGRFMDNVVLQIKNGPMDFQVREPISPLFGSLKKTNQVLELQITQEYTGQQKHICYLIPQWKEVLDFDTFAEGNGSTVKKIINGKLFPQKYCGIAAVSNIGDDMNWTGHVLAQANLYGYGRLTWDTGLDCRCITEEWVGLTFDTSEKMITTISDILLKSWHTYENYTSPLGIGWMVNPNHHYGPSVEGYEYSMWGTYHRADLHAIGVDRTVQNGTGYAGRYYPENAERYNHMETCPEELLLFFHRVPYDYRLKSGKTLLQHIYDTHFEGVEQVERFKEQWIGLKGFMDTERYEHVLAMLEIQLTDAAEWRDVVNSYFFRKTGIPDEKGRTIY